MPENRKVEIYISKFTLFDLPQLKTCPVAFGSVVCVQLRDFSIKNRKVNKFR